MTDNINDKSIWDEIYRKTDYRPGWERPGVDHNLLEMIQKHYIPREEFPGMALLDSGCGTGRNAPLAEQLAGRTGRAVSYLGVDFAESAVAYCRQNYPGQHFLVQDLCADLDGAAVASSGPYHVIVDCGCFHAIPPESREAYMRNISRLSVPGGLLLIGAWFRTAERDGVDPHYFPFLYINEWFFNEEDIQRLWGGRFSFLESRIDREIYPGLHDGYGYFALRSLADQLP